MTVSRRTAILFFLLVAAWSSNAAAELTLTPALSVREEYNDNIELTRDNRIDDFITTINPSLGISLKTSILELGADYGLNLRFYAKNSDRNETDLTQAQRAKVDTTLTLLPERFFLKVSDVFERVPIEPRGQVAYDNYFANLTNTNRLTVNPYLQYPLTPTLVLNAGYTYNNLWYEDPIGDDSESHAVTGGITKQFGERLSTFVNYTHIWQQPKNTPKYQQKTGSVGASMKVTPKLSVNGMVGVNELDYGDVTVGYLFKFVDRLPNGNIRYQLVPVNIRNKSSSVIWSATAAYSLTDRLSLAVGASQSVNQSIYEGSVRNRSFNGSISYDAKVPVTLSVTHTEGKYELKDRRDKSTGATLSMGVPLTPNITLRIAGTYNHHNFDPDGEKVNRYGLTTGFDYALTSHATLSFGYTYNNSDSSLDDNDYSNNVAFVQAKYTF